MQHFDACYAARAASKAWAAAVADNTLSQIDETCFYLAVVDKVIEINCHTRLVRVHDRRRTPKSYTHWQEETNALLSEVRRMALSALLSAYANARVKPPPARTIPTEACVQSVGRTILDLWCDEFDADTGRPPSQMFRLAPFAPEFLGRFASRAQGYTVQCIEWLSPMTLGHHDFDFVYFEIHCPPNGVPTRRAIEAPEEEEEELSLDTAPRDKLRMPTVPQPPAATDTRQPLGEMASSAFNVDPQAHGPADGKARRKSPWARFKLSRLRTNGLQNVPGV